MKNKRNSVIKDEMAFEYIKNNNLTKDEFCIKCGIRVKDFENLIDFKRDMSLEVVFRVAKEIGVEIHKIFADDTEFLKEFARKNNKK